MFVKCIKTYKFVQNDRKREEVGGEINEMYTL